MEMSHRRYRIELSDWAIGWAIGLSHGDVLVLIIHSDGFMDVLSKRSALYIAFANFYATGNLLGIFFRFFFIFKILKCWKRNSFFKMLKIIFQYIYRFNPHIIFKYLFIKPMYHQHQIDKKLIIMKSDSQESTSLFFFVNILYGWGKIYAHREE